MGVTLSVVVPVLDDAAALARLLGALAAQTREPDEVVVVDNGCRDGSVPLALAHGARVVVEPTPGIPAAAATGYDAARCDVVVRCDADTVPPPGWLEHVAALFDADPGLHAVTGTGDFVDLPRWQAATVGRLYLLAYGALVHGALAQVPLWGSNMALRRGCWERVRDRVERVDPEVHDDMDLTAALGPATPTRYVPGLRVGVSGRSLRGARQLRRRFTRGLRTVRRAWAAQPVWRRWAVRWGFEAGEECRHDVGA